MGPRRLVCLLPGSLRMPSGSKQPQRKKARNVKTSIYDTTLRDGTQSENVSFSVDDKLKIATLLDDLGVDYIEGGWPGSNARDAEFFSRARALNLSNSRLAAFGSTCHPRNL